MLTSILCYSHGWTKLVNSSMIAMQGCRNRGSIGICFSSIFGKHSREVSICSALFYFVPLKYFLPSFVTAMKVISKIDKD